MKISIIGCGYVGCVTGGVCFADLGHDVVLVDVDPAKVRAITAGQSPIYEPGLEDLIRKNRDRISATTDLRVAVGSTDITFVAVGTPHGKTGGRSIYPTSLPRAKRLGRPSRKRRLSTRSSSKARSFPGRRKRWPARFLRGGAPGRWPEKTSVLAQTQSSCVKEALSGTASPPRTASSSGGPMIPGLPGSLATSMRRSGGPRCL